MALLVPGGHAAPLWSWLLRQSGRGGLSPQVSRTLAAAAEVVLPPQLTPRELRAVCRTALVRLAQLPPTELRELCGHLELLEKVVPLLARAGRGFHTLDRAARHRCLQGCERSRWSLLAHGHAQLCHLVTMAYMQTSEAWPLLLSAGEPSAEGSRVA